VLSGFSFDPNRFRRAGSNTALAAGKAVRGTTIHVTLNRAATLTISFRRLSPQQPTDPQRPPKNHRRKSPGPRAITRAGHAGVNEIPFTGRIDGTPLKRGMWRATVTATAGGDSAGPLEATFRIAKG
jgi:hypothetical protein